MYRDNKQLRPRRFMLFYSAIFPLLFLVATDVKAANPTADYPSRPITYVNHSSPGANSDIFSRLVSDIVQSEKMLSQPLFVLNRPGGNGGIAMEYLFQRKGNPHIILNVSSSVFISTTILEKLPFNITSFTPLVTMAADGGVVVVRNDSPFKTFDDIIAEARKRPKELVQGGSSSLIGALSVISRSIQKVKGVQWNFIPFKTQPDALINLLSGNLHFAFLSPDAVLDHVRAGKVRVLLACTLNRYPEFKDVPTMKETGLGDPIVIYRGILGPPNMPEYAVKKLEATFKKVMDSERFQKFVRESMMEPAWFPSKECGKLLEREHNQWKERLSDPDLLKRI